MPADDPAELEDEIRRFNVEMIKKEVAELSGAK